MFDSETSHFSLFDFLGYLIPGAICLLVIRWAVLLWDISFWGIKDWILLLEVNLRNDDSSLLFSLWGIVLSYLMGHLLAFLSSVTVEVLSHKLYGYPSDFLLKRFSLEEARNIINEKKEKDYSAPKTLTAILYGLIIIILAPISLPAFLFGKLLRFELYYLKPLDEMYAWNIMDRLCVLMEKLNIDMDEGKKVTTTRFGRQVERNLHDSDFHRIAYHYEYEKTERHQNKLDSYIALYDFMRAVTFLAVSLLWVFIIILTKQSLWCPQAVLFMFFFLPLPYMCFMAFMKFYRRHTLETFMCLLTDEELASMDSKYNERPSKVNTSDTKKNDTSEIKKGKKKRSGKK